MILRRRFSATFQGLTLAFDHPDIFRAQWKLKFNAYIEQMNSRLISIQKSLNDVGRPQTPAHRQRFELLDQAFRKQKQFVAQLLKEFSSTASEVSLIQVAAQRIASQQHFDSYTQNIFRDWAWGDTENKKNLELVQKLLQKTQDIDQKNIVILGSGAGRLAIDIHKHFQPQETVAVDINPLLLTVGNELLSGNSVDLYEFPYPPLSTDQCAALHSLKTDLRKPTNFNFVFADGLNLPFAPQSIDILLTPWFIDIVPMDFYELGSRLNHFIKPDGQWVNFGPLSYRPVEKASSYTATEIEELLPKCGFDCDQAGSTSLPYLQSPHSTLKREELVFHFNAMKSKSVKQWAKHSALPTYLYNPNEIVPAFGGFEANVQDARSRVDILSLFDGKTSLSQVARLISKHSGIGEATALENLVQYFIIQHEQL